MHGGATTQQRNQFSRNIVFIIASKQLWKKSEMKMRQKPAFKQGSSMQVDVELMLVWKQSVAYVKIIANFVTNWHIDTSVSVHFFSSVSSYRHSLVSWRFCLWRNSKLLVTRQDLGSIDPSRVISEHISSLRYVNALRLVRFLQILMKWAER